MIKIITTGYSYSLIIISIISILGLLATGHQISLNDFGQIKLIIESLIFFLTGLIIKRHLTTDTVKTILLILTQVSLIDIYLELSHEDNTAVVNILIFIMTILTLYLIYRTIKTKR